MTAATRSSGPRWWNAPFRLLQTNLREQDALLDAESSVAQLIDLGYDTWLCNAGGIVYFYPAHEAYQRMASRLHERPSGDMVGDVLTAARAKGIRLLSRFDFSRLPTEIIDEHPEWAYLDKDGNRYTEDGLTAICPRSDYHEHLAPRILRDFVQRYAVDGIFFNWLQFPEVTYRGRYNGVCQCERCRIAFQAAHPGQEHPRALGDPTYHLWLDVALARLTELAERYSEVVNDVRPGTPLMLADVRMDIAFLETNSPMGGRENDHWWQHTPSEIASVNRVSDPMVPALVHSSVNLGLPYRQMAEEPAQFRRYIAQALSRGALPSSVVIGTVDTGRFPCFVAAAPMLRFLGAQSAFYQDYTPTSRVAVLRPKGGTAMSAMQSTADPTEYRGVYTALQEAHIPFDVLGLQFQDQLVQDNVLARYDVIVVPGAEGVDEPLRRALDAFAHDGGALVLTGEVSRGGRPVFDADPGRSTTRLAGLAELGGRFVGPVDGRTDVVLFPVLGHFDRVTVRDGATAGALALSTQAPFGPPEISGGNTARDGNPAVITWSYGHGLVTRFPWAMGLTIHASGLTGLGQVFSHEVRELLRTEEFNADLPAAIELTRGTSGGRHVLHFVNHSGGRGDRVRDPLPARGSIHLWGDLADAARQSTQALLREDSIVAVEDVDDTVRISLALEDVLEVLVLG